MVDKKKLLDAVFTGYRTLLLAIFGLIPSLIIVYLHFFQDPTLLYDAPVSHIIAISLATFTSTFIFYVTWRCYQDSGEVFLRWLALGFLGFTLIYAPHGLFTLQGEQNPWLFLLYGPVSRLVMAACFLVAVLSFDKVDVTEKQRSKLSVWIIAIVVFLLIDILVAIWALSSWRAVAWLRLSMEYGAIVMYLISLAWMVRRRVRSPLMVLYGISIAWFAQASLAFTYGIMWNHQWWLAHIIFAGGFLLLSYGLVQAYVSSRSFAKVFSLPELLDQLRDANQQLKRLAATDHLTGVANRREFMCRLTQEMARSARSQSALSLLLIDLDHFKSVNDNYGHQAGDNVLIEFVSLVQSMLRPGDLLARVGGEEFTIMLTDTDFEQAIVTAERLRTAVQQHAIHTNDMEIYVTTSIGVASHDPSISTIDELMHLADQRMYKAKNEGRNRVQSE